MNSSELEQALYQHPATRQLFEGVYPRDCLPKDVKYPSGIICNTDPASQPGEHWICIYVDHYGVGEYFDSFGLPPLFKEFKKYLTEYCVSWIFNDKTIQSITSNVCGLYCMYYLIMRSKGFTMRELMKVFSDDCVSNDKIVVELFK